ncbi:hypothetical protein KIH74_34540 [Kineosporia sp. J2-2]|uniref:Integral membrane protein n=1 Tax=Kineosporia corallincola TaxID=2835133 RepID=A0ABS5TTK1_9ACTN|nr:hypothetical protein [Kineosporia corallincola]MBT0774115.1 hypothetical protein [Kineosporia corallincola]
MASQESPAPVGREGRQAPPEREGLRLLVCVLVAVEALALLAGAVALVIEGLGAERPGNAIGLALVAAVIGLSLAAAVRGLHQGARWTRGPVVTWQLLQAGVGMPVSASSYWYFGVPILAIAVVVGFLVAGKHVIAQEETNPA